jgi:predicted acyltransferase
MVSLDQFRGFTMLGMLVVNFLGSYAVCPRLLRHTHDYCSLADTIMPQFLFAAGLSCVVFGIFWQVCDLRGWQSGLLRTLGTNSLAAYILHDVCGWCISPFLSRDASVVSVLAGLAVFVAATAGVCRLLEYRGWYLRV